MKSNVNISVSTFKESPTTVKKKSLLSPSNQQMMEGLQAINAEVSNQYSLTTFQGIDKDVNEVLVQR